MELSENQKAYILRHDYTKTIQQIAKILGVSGHDVMGCYSEMVDSGYYLRHKKPSLQSLMWEERNERKRKLKEVSKENREELNQGSDSIPSNDSYGDNIFNVMWGTPSESENNSLRYRISGWSRSWLKNVVYRENHRN